MPSADSPSERLAVFGWSKKDAAEFAVEFGQIRSPFCYSSQGVKLYTQAKFKEQKNDKLQDRLFDSSIARHHLLGDYDVAVMPPDQPNAIGLDWDNKEEWDFFRRWISRDRADLSWMIELGSQGGHAYIPVHPGTSASEWAPLIREMVTKATGITDRARLADIIRVHTKRKLRLPFRRRILFATGRLIEINNPADALLAWLTWKSLRRHRFSTIWNVVKNYRKPGRPRTERRISPSAASSPHATVESSNQCSPNLSVRRSRQHLHPQTIEREVIGKDFAGQVQENAASCADSQEDREFRELRGYESETRGISDRVCLQVGSMRGRRYANGARVVALLLNLGCPGQALADEALYVFLRMGSKDAARDPASVREWLERRVIPWVHRNHRPRS